MMSTNKCNHNANYNLASVDWLRREMRRFSAGRDFSCFFDLIPKAS